MSDEKYSKTHLSGPVILASDDAFKTAWDKVIAKEGVARSDSMKAQADEFVSTVDWRIANKEVHSIAWGVLRVPMRTKWLAQDDDGAIYAFSVKPIFLEVAVRHARWAPAEPLTCLAQVGVRNVVPEVANRLWQLPQ